MGGRRVMNHLFLTREQASILADDLRDYVALKDDSEREVAKEFIISFEDKCESGAFDTAEIKMQPIPNYTIISDGGE